MNKIDQHFSGSKSSWHEVFDTVVSTLKECGENIQVAPTDSYISILKNGEEFAIIQITSDSMDIGIKLKDAEPTARFEASGSWNTMMTHRVQINNPNQVDKELMDWLRKAYDCN